MNVASTVETQRDFVPAEHARAGAAPIRVAHVLHTFGMGGAERIAALLANHADREGFRPMIVCLGENRADGRWELAGDVTVVELRKSSGNDPRVVFRLARVLREHQVDVMHSNNWGTLLETSLARQAAEVAHHVHVEHGAELADLRLGWVRRKLRGTAMRWAFRRVDALVSVCDGVSRLLTYRCGYPAERVQQIPNGVEAPPEARDPAERSRIRAALGVGPETCVVGSVGRLAQVKDFGTAIEAVARLVHEGRDAHLLLVGDGPERRALGEQAETCGIARRVHLVGEQGRVGPWLAAMDVYVNSSLSEGMSLSILEGMSAGLPLVVTGVGENAALLGPDSGGGLVVPPGSPQRLAAALRQLAGDPALRRRLGTAARRRYGRHYTVERMVSGYETLYRSVVCARTSSIWQPLGSQ